MRITEIDQNVLPQEQPVVAPQRIRSPQVNNARALPGYDRSNLLHTSWTRIFTRQQDAAKRSGKAWTITQDYAWDIINKQGWKCALSGVPFTPGGGRSRTQASMDRIDSTRGYEPGNVQYVTLVVNLAKKNMTDADFITMCKQVSRYAK
jgi:hypothetical protein